MIEYENRKTIRKDAVIAAFVAIMLVLCGVSYAQSAGIRFGIGQFATQAEEIDGSTGNSFMLGANLNPKPSFRIDIGIRYNGVRETEISGGIPASVSPFTIERITRKIGYTGAYIAPGLNIDLSKVGSGFGAYIYAGPGLAFATVVNRVDYAAEGASSAFIPEEQKDKDDWKFFWLAGAGVKIKVFYIGVFGEFSYYDGDPMEYNPITVEGVELMPGGSIEPRGFAGYIGLSWN